MAEATKNGGASCPARTKLPVVPKNTYKFVDMHRSLKTMWVILRSVGTRSCRHGTLSQI